MPQYSAIILDDQEEMLFCFCLVQIQTQSIFQTGGKFIIALNGKVNAKGRPFAMLGDGVSAAQRTDIIYSSRNVLRAAGITALKSGWQTSVTFLTRDRNWVATSSSDFGCHLLKTFDGCTDQQEAQAIAGMFVLANNQTNNNISSSTHDETDKLTIYGEGRRVDAPVCITSVTVCVSAAITLMIQNY